MLEVKVGNKPNRVTNSL